MKKKEITKEYPKVSIITCVYNGEKYISKLFDSVLNMGYPNIEHIVVNDGSTDGTEDIVFKYADLYKNKENANLYIKYIKQENMGLGGATNTGLKAITGEYWTWINCDDWYDENAFNFAVKKFDKKTDMVFMNQKLIWYDNSGAVIKTEERFNKKLIKTYSNTLRLRKMLCKDGNIMQAHYLVKTSSFDRLNPNRTIDPFRFTQDLQLSWTLVSNLKISYEAKAISNVLERSDSLWKNTFNYYPYYRISAYRSFLFLNLKKADRISQINLILLGGINEKLMSLFYANNFAEFNNYYHSRYLLNLKMIKRKYYKYLYKKVFAAKFALSNPLFRWCVIKIKNIKNKKHNSSIF